MTIKESWGSVGPWHIAEGYTLAAGRLMGCLHQHHIFVGFLIPVGGFGLGLEDCVAAAVIWVLFQPRTSVSVHVLGKNSGQLPLAHWFSAGVTLVPRRHLAMPDAFLVFTAGLRMLLSCCG